MPISIQQGTDVQVLFKSVEYTHVLKHVSLPFTALLTLGLSS